MKGYFVLSAGKASPPLPLFNQRHIGAHLKSRAGSYCLDGEGDEEVVVDFPLRNKSVQLISNQNAKLREAVTELDNMPPTINYRDKLRSMLAGFDSFSGTVNNLCDSTSSSLAILSTEPLYCYGLHDVDLNTTYFVWTTDPSLLPNLEAQAPLKFLIYRFPLPTMPIFFQSEAVCSKWFRWMKTHGSTLFAFNSFERRHFDSYVI